MTTYLKTDYAKEIINIILDNSRPVNNKMWSLQELCVARIENRSSIYTMILYGAIPDAEYPKPATYSVLKAGSVFHPTAKLVLMRLKKMLGEDICRIDIKSDELRAWGISMHNSFPMELQTLELNYYRCRYPSDEWYSDSDSNESG